LLILLPATFPLNLKTTVKPQSVRTLNGKIAPDKSAVTRINIERAIRAIPRGKVSTYGAIARAAGLPGAARQVARILRRGFGLPWQRVLGSGGHIKLTGDSAIEQRFRLDAEGVRFRGRRVDMKAHEWKASLPKATSKSRTSRPRKMH
jgi:methylated-DNA-protein-cysteine methyltransferase-like protein